MLDKCLLWCFLISVLLLTLIVRATDAGQVSDLVLLDLSAAFNTVDHHIVMDVLSSHFGVSDHIYEWFHSYLSGQTDF